MDESLLRLLVELGQLLDSAGDAISAGAERLISQQPLLLDDTMLADLDIRAVRLYGAEHVAAGLALRYLRAIRQQYLEDPLSYPLGAGPLDITVAVSL